MRPNRAKQFLVGFAVVLGAAGAAAAVTVLSKSESNDSMAKSESSSTVTKPADAIETAPIPSEKVVVERVTIFPYGLEPEEIVRPAGPFLLAIDNRAGSEDFTIEVVSERNELLHTDGIRKGSARTRRMLSLPPGKYVLRENKHPKWTCSITITP